jgi:hypothetical protein
MLIKQINLRYTFLYTSFIYIFYIHLLYTFMRMNRLSAEAEYKVRKFYKSIDTELQARKEVDLFCKAFLNPFEVSLRASGRP